MAPARPTFSRRTLLRGTATLGALVTMASRGTARAAQTGLTTLSRVLLMGPPGRGGFRTVVAGPGEPHVVRTDLGADAGARRGSRRRPLVVFVQLSDVHVLDAQSPLRLEFTDRFADSDTVSPGDGGLSPGLFSAAYRPQEMLTAHVAEAMVRRVNQARRGPVSGRRLAFAIQTGDNSDSSQANEIRWNIDLMDGGTIRPDSGSPHRWEGVADTDTASYDTAYWHPDGAPAGRPTDEPRRRYGFPLVPGLLDAARRPFRAEGLSLPWYAVFGNHDGLVQGNFPHADGLDEVAVGSLKLVGPPPEMTRTELLAGVLGNFANLIDSLKDTDLVRTVTPDPDRRTLSRAEIVEEHFDTTGRPVGHGFTPGNRSEGVAYYAFDRGRVRFVVLDTVNPNGSSAGSLDQRQFAWLQLVLLASQDRYVVVCSHHPSGSMDNSITGAGDGPEVGPRVLGDEVVALLLDQPQVIAWVSGHTHTHGVSARPSPQRRGGGFWEITTASHIDWPQQSRLIEILDNRDGTLSIFTTVLDHAGDVGATAGLGSPLQLAGLARELAANDWQERGRVRVREGSHQDRNVELVIARPELG